MLAFEFQTDTEQNVQNYQNNLPEFCREAALVERDVAPGSRQQFANLVNKDRELHFQHRSTPNSRQEPGNSVRY